MPLRSLWRRYRNSSLEDRISRRQAPAVDNPWTRQTRPYDTELSRVRFTLLTSRPVRDDEPSVEGCGSSRRSACKLSETVNPVHLRLTSSPALFHSSPFMSCCPLSIPPISHIPLHRSFAEATRWSECTTYQSEIWRCRRHQCQGITRIPIEGRLMRCLLSWVSSADVGNAFKTFH